MLSRTPEHVCEYETSCKTNGAFLQLQFEYQGDPQNSMPSVLVHQLEWDITDKFSMALQVPMYEIEPN